MAGILNSVVGHERIVNSFYSAIHNQKMPAQLIFYGPEGVGKKQVALGLIQVLFCENNRTDHTDHTDHSNHIEGAACGECGSCIRVQQGIAENLIIVQAEKNLIKIDQSHQILEFLSLQAWSTHNTKNSNKTIKRAVLINDAHCLNSQAANALLKIFEEPPEDTYFFLITHRHRTLLPTVRSRAKMVSFYPLTIAQMQYVYPKAEKWKLLSARGSFQKLLSLEDTSNFRQESVNCLKLLLESPDEFIISSWRDQIKDREVAAQYLRWWIIFLRDAAVLASGSSRAIEQVISQDQISIIEVLRKYSQEKIHSLFSLLLKSERALWAYQDPVLLFESLFLTGFYYLGDATYVD